MNAILARPHARCGDKTVQEACVGRRVEMVSILASSLAASERWRVRDGEFSSEQHSLEATMIAFVTLDSTK